MPRAATAAILGLVCAGCGGGDDSASTGPAPAPPPRDEYVAALDDVCREEGELPRGGDGGGLGGAKRYIRRLKRTNVRRRALLARYEQIVPPPEHRRFHRRYLDAARDQVALTDRAIDALERGDGAAYGRLTRRLGAVLVRRGDLVRGQSADFQHCGQP